MSLIREFAQEFNVLVPHRAFSAATLTALGADHVVMHPLGMLGPIDPSVGTPFNPSNPENPTRRLNISVEDVASYINLVRDDVGIHHEEELVRAFEILAKKIHPLALGSVKRSTSQSRMLGAKLLKSRKSVPVLDEHSIAEVVERLASQLYFHGHPISRSEAREDLKLSFVEDAPDSVADAMYALYEAYADESDMALEKEFNPYTETTHGNSVVLPPPPQMGGANQFTPTTITVQQSKLGPYIAARVESVARSDRSVVEFDAVITRQWSGETKVNLSVLRSAWEQEP